MKLADYARHDGTGLATLVRQGQVLVNGVPAASAARRASAALCGKPM